MSNAVPLSEPKFSGKEWALVKECLDTGWVSSAGKFVTEFERRIAAYVGCRHAVAVSSGTAALQLALEVAGVGAGDEVLVPTLTFIAPVNAVHYRGAVPVFMDCDGFYNIDARKTVDFILNETVVRRGVSVNRRTRRPVKAVIPVHVFGNAVDLQELARVCRSRNIRVVEDATESLGTVYHDGKHAGTVGDIGCLSFNGNKIITTGGGGMIITDDDGYAKRAAYLANQAKDDPLRYVHHDVGYNFRLNNIQAALGVGQLDALPEILKAKKENYAFYQTKINAIDGLALAGVPGYARNNYWMYAIQIDPRKYPLDKEGLLKRLLDDGIQARPVWGLNHRQRPYRACQEFKIRQAVALWKATLNIPCSAGITREQMLKTVRVLSDTM